MHHRNTRFATTVVLGALLSSLVAFAEPRGKQGDSPEAMGDLIEDIVITEQVYQRLMNEEFLGEAVLEVETADGTVSLRGYVVHEEDRDRALTLARSVEGVESVHNGICVVDVEPGCLPTLTPGAGGQWSLEPWPNARLVEA